MVFRNDQCKFVGAEQLIAQVRRMPCYEPETGVHAAFFQSGFDFSRGNFLYHQANRGMFSRKPTEQVWNQRNVQDGDNTQVQYAAQLSGLAREVLKTFLELAQYRPGMFLEDQAGGRKQDAFAAALKESNTQPGFEVADLLRDRRLRDAKAIGGSAEVARLGHSQKISQMTHLNGIVHKVQGG
jgi:hypothetical protein